MNLRHAAALALVGWYLMTPPPKGREIDSTAPLSKWEAGAAFNSPDECNKARGELLEKVNRKIADPNMPEDERHFYLGKSGFAQCISTDDPRLREK
jgi:hypothetical protein